MAFGLYYPDFLTSDVVFEPDEGRGQPIIGSQPKGRVFSGLQQRLATGRKITWRSPAATNLRRWRFIFRSMSDEDADARDAFGEAVAGGAFELAWPDAGTLYLVTFTGPSLAFDPVTTEFGWDWEEVLEAQP